MEAFKLGSDSTGRASQKTTAAAAQDVLETAGVEALRARALGGSFGRSKATAGLGWKWAENEEQTQVWVQRCMQN